ERRPVGRRFVGRNGDQFFGRSERAGRHGGTRIRSRFGAASRQPNLTAAAPTDPPAVSHVSAVAVKTCSATAADAGGAPPARRDTSDRSRAECWLVVTRGRPRQPRQLPARPGGGGAGTSAN